MNPPLSTTFKAETMDTPTITPYALVMQSIVRTKSPNYKEYYLTYKVEILAKMLRFPFFLTAPTM